MSKGRDHGGGIDAAIASYGGVRSDWIDLSTGINPNPYPLPNIPDHFWTTLPDHGPQTALLDAARTFWNVPNEARIVAASGVSALIAQLPHITDAASFHITKPTYNEHEAAFKGAGRSLNDHGGAQIYVHPNNPDGRFALEHNVIARHKGLTIIDESFCDTTPDNSLIQLTKNDDYIVLKGLGKFWGLAGLRLGFAICSPTLADMLLDRLGPWAISGPAQFVGAAALQDRHWAQERQVSLDQSAQRLDVLLNKHNLQIVGGTSLFRLVNTSDAKHVQNHLAKHHIWTRIFPYSDTWVRFGLPRDTTEFDRLNDALKKLP